MGHSCPPEGVWRRNSKIKKTESEGIGIEREENIRVCKKDWMRMLESKNY